MNYYLFLNEINEIELTTIAFALLLFAAMISFSLELSVEEKIILLTRTLFTSKKSKVFMIKKLWQNKEKYQIQHSNINWTRFRISQNSRMYLVLICMKISDIITRSYIRILGKWGMMRILSGIHFRKLFMLT